MIAVTSAGVSTSAGYFFPAFGGASAQDLQLAAVIQAP
jgi:hypothetical protein